MPNIFRAALCLFVLAGAPIAVSAQEAPARGRAITALRGDVYQVTDGDQVTLFLVTPEGIVLVDPLSRDLVAWLVPELEARFPGRPVRYVVHTSHRYERAAGSSLLAKTAQAIGHEASWDVRARAAATLPPSLAPLDADQDGVLDRSEALAIGADASRLDRNGDGTITPGEVWGDVASPDRTYQSRDTIELGGRVVELIHPGDGLGEDATVVLFVAERILFAPGLPVGEAPASFAASPPELVDTLRRIEELPFETVIAERGDAGTVADVALVREYVAEMIAGVKAALTTGDGVDELRTSLELDRFSGLRNFATRRGRNIDDTYGRLRLLTVAVSGAGEFVRMQRGRPGCAERAIPTIEVACEGTGGPTFGGSGAATVMVGRVGGGVEFFSAGKVRGREQVFQSLPSSYLYREQWAMSFLGRYDAGRIGAFAVAATGGLARIAAIQESDRRGIFSNGFTLTTTARAIVAGADLTVGRSVRVIVPVRFVRTPYALNAPVGTPGAKWNIRAGIGVAVPLARVAL